MYGRVAYLAQQIFATAAPDGAPLPFGARPLEIAAPAGIGVGTVAYPSGGILALFLVKFLPRGQM